MSFFDPGGTQRNGGTTFEGAGLKLPRLWCELESHSLSRHILQLRIVRRNPLPGISLRYSAAAFRAESSVSLHSGALRFPAFAGSMGMISYPQFAWNRITSLALDTAEEQQVR